MSCLLFDLAIKPLAALKGYSEIPAVRKKLANLIADDTMGFLSEDDNLEDLEKILDRWCMASTAVFNIAKTQILPTGKREASPDQQQVPQNIHIAAEDKAITILGAPGKSNYQLPGAWRPLVLRYNKSLENWEKSNPTMDGCKKIGQMVVGGMTQYLTQVQGMPKNIEEKLKKRIRQFLWVEKKLSPVNFETLLASKKEGGQEALDIEAKIRV
ncbi:hypothetical protein BT96DRAFT_960435 [Gymnopus androsaceus JB14]|uniref:Reverse transcriptase domain-containing protein n=1 Tax=Gymnopus androsaceus JB14 TaxID=1447944 RepID=A0A6A4GPF8_9AGAR|nr:hypothetical protein BT96DRAFT_960435 [Gymnopus androsaceus JB14]